MITPRVITAPTTEPVSLTEVKRQLHIDTDDTDHDDLLNLYIPAARRYYEWRTGRTLHQQTLAMWYDSFPGGPIELPRATPLISVDHIKYTESAGTVTTWPPAEYVLDTKNEPGCVEPAYSESYPSFTPYPVTPIEVQYIAGIETASPVTEAPEEDKIPILLLVGGQYENREAYAMQAFTATLLPYGVEAFIAARTVSYAF